MQRYIVRDTQGNDTFYTTEPELHDWDDLFPVREDRDFQREGWILYRSTRLFRDWSTGEDYPYSWWVREEDGSVENLWQ